MFNCLARICPPRRVDAPAPAVIALVAQPVTGTAHAPSSLPTLSASAQTRWRQVCNLPLKSQLDARDLLMPGTRLDLSFEERTEVTRALDHLPAGGQFWSAVATACHLGNPVRFAAVETLIRHGLLDPNLTVDGDTLLHMVCMHGVNAWPHSVHPLSLEQRITKLIMLGASIEHPALPAINLLQRTWERDDTDGHLAAAALLSHGCDPLEGDEGHFLLLHRAAETGNLPVLRGWQCAGLSMKLSFGYLDHTALHLAALHGHHDALRLLVTEGGVDINALTRQNESALHFAVLHTHIEAVKTILELQATSHGADSAGRSPLYIAVESDSEELRALLVQHGADPYAVDQRFPRLTTAAALYEQLHDRPWPDTH